MTDIHAAHQQETTMQTAEPSPRNPIAKSFGAGINQPQVIASKRRGIRRVNRRGIEREFEFDG